MQRKYAPAIGQIGSQMDTTFFLFDNCIQNADRVPIEEYERMLETDETVAVGLQFLTLSILVKLGEYTHSSKRIEKFIRGNFEDMSGNLCTACEEILTALWAGYSGSEIVWKAAGGRVVVDKIVTYHPRTLLVKVDRETGEYAGLKQWRWFDGEPVDIPLEKSVLFSYGKTFGNHYGRSILKPLRKNWLLKDPILKMWGRGLDRFGSPLLAIFTTDEEIDDPARPGQKTNQMAHAGRMLQNVQNGTGFVLRTGSKEDGSESRIEVLTTGGAGLGDAFEKAVLYLNKMILRGLLVPSLIFDNQGSGSYALGQTHMAAYNMTVSSIYAALKEALLEQVVRRMVEYNFGPQQDYGDFVEKKLSQEDRKMLSEFFLNLTDGGYITPQNQDDMDAVRDALNLPKRDVEAAAELARGRAAQEYNRYPVKGGEAIGDPLGDKPARTAG